MNDKSLTKIGRDPPTKMEKVTSIVKEKFSLIWSIDNFCEFLDRKYEFSSPVYIPNSPGTSKWKFVVFPEIVYPEGWQIVLRLFNMWKSNDDKCYSVNYRLSILDKNSSDHAIQNREKVFRYYLDYDQCCLTTNRTIKDKNLLQSSGALTICCEIDLLFCENPEDKTLELLKSYENISVPVMNDASTTNEKLTKSENTDISPPLNVFSAINNTQTKSENINNSTLSPNYLSSENIYKKSDEGVKIINSLSENNDNGFPASIVKVENTHFNKGSPKHHKGFMISPNEYEKKATGLSEKIDNFFNKTREKGTKGNWNVKNLQDLQALSKDLNFLYSTKYQYDVTINTEDGLIRAHKAILAARSDYFRKTLVFGKEEIQIAGISHVTLDAILFYMYTGQAPQMTFNLGMDILRVCDQFNLDHLKDMAQISIKSQMNISNVTDIFQIATEMKLEDLKTHALKFIAKNNEAVINSTKWNEMVNTNPHGTGEILLTIASFQNKLHRC